MLVGIDMLRDRKFYERRITEEREAAADAADPRGAERHCELADLYEQKLMATSTGRPRPMLKVVFEQADA